MADVARNIPRMTAVEYLELERQASWKHEFVDGIVYAMAGASRTHNLISGDAFGALLASVAPPCRVFGSDMKVHIKSGADERYYYPDVHVSCSDLDNNECFSSHPVLIIEGLSPNTAETDRRDKFDDYRQLPSLQEYVLLAQDERRAEIFRRRSAWQHETFTEHDEVTLESIGVALPVSRVYSRVAL